jgi:RNA polymerase sigma factor (sigma-70 family)
MAAGHPDILLQHVRKLAAPPGIAQLADKELVTRFAAHGDEAAFEVLVQRHGPMVLRVCRRVLGNDHDAEDAFQGTFLVLSRKTHSLRRQESVASWLYGVAYRLALRGRAEMVRRRSHESRVSPRPPHDPLAEISVREAQAVVDQELAGLPEKYRAPLVLCCLEGVARDEAAQRLGWTLSTLQSRLQEARDRLRRRLGRRGLTLPAALLAAVLTEGAAPAAVPGPVALGTAKAAGLFAAGQAAAAGALSGRAVALAESVLRALALTRLKIVAVVWVGLAALGTAATVLAHQALAEKPADPSANRKKESANQPRKEKEAAQEILQVRGAWPQWRGPNRDGVVHGVTAPRQWPRALKEEWKVAVGKGVASPVVAGGKVYLFTRQKDDAELVQCFSLAGGKEIWRSKPCPAPYRVGVGEGNADDRPRSTPTVAGNRVFTLGMTGVLSCLDARTGKLLWRKNTGYIPYMGSSPLVADGLCIVHVAAAKNGGLTAFHIRTGEVKWRYSEGPSPMSASPILVDLAGERQVVSYYHGNLLGVSVATGKKLWTAPSAPGAVITPVLYKDLLIYAAGDRTEPLHALRLEKGPKGMTAKEVWKAKGHPLYYSSPVIARDLLFGMSVGKLGHLFCLDALTGKTLWEGPPRMGRADRPEGNASILNVGSAILFLTNGGRLLVVKPNGTAYERIAEYRLSDSDTHAHPVFLGDRILVKDATALRLFRIGDDAGKR